MNATRQSAIVHGVIGGLLAGTVVTLWFLIADIIAGTPLRTPGELGGTIFGRPYAGDLTLVALYTLLHFGTFAILGGLTSWLLAATDVTPGILLGMFFGVCVLNGIHYTGLLLTDAPLLNVLPWIHVVGANLVAGVAFMSFLHWAGRVERPLGWGFLRDHPLLEEGVKVGMIGAGVVAIWFLLIDIIKGAPLHTPAALGAVVFQGAGAGGDTPVAIDPAIIAAYTVLHLVAFAALGIVFVAVARGIERLPSLAYLVALAAILLEALTFATLVLYGNWVLGSLSVWTVGVANIIAVAAMGTAIWRTHPVLRKQLETWGLASTP